MEFDPFAITLDAKSAFKYGALPYFTDGIVGMFVRVKLGKDVHLWTRIIAAEQTEDGSKTYVWNPAPGYSRRFGVYLHCDRLPETAQVPLSTISSSKPTEVEIAQYVKEATAEDGKDKNLTLALPTSSDAEALLSNFRSQVVDRRLTDDDAQAILKLNEFLKTATANPLNISTLAMSMELKMRTLNKDNSDPSAIALIRESGELPPAAEGSQRDSQSGTPLLPSATPGSQAGRPSLAEELGLGRSSTATVDFLNSTQSVLFEDSQDGTTGGLGFIEEVRQKNEFLAQQTADRTAEQEQLVSLTERNKRENRRWVLSGEHYEKEKTGAAGVRRGGTLWEINNEKRWGLCQQYDDIKEGKLQLEDRSKVSTHVGPARTLDNADTLLTHCLSLRKKHEEKQNNSIPDDILALSQSFSQTLEESQTNAQARLSGMPRSSSSIELGGRSSSTLVRTSSRPAAFRKRGRDGENQ